MSPHLRWRVWSPVGVQRHVGAGRPEALTRWKWWRSLRRRTDEAFDVQFVPADALEAQQAAATDPMQQSFTGLMRGYAAGDPIDMRETLKAFPVTLTSVAEFAREVQKDFR